MASEGQTNFDVAVVGGGVIGLACAWRAAVAGASVCVVERDRLGSGASGVAAGMLAPVGEAHFGEEELLELNVRSLRAWPRFAAELAAAGDGESILEHPGAVHVALDRDEAEGLRWQHRFQEAQELETRWLSPSECRRLEPGLSPRVAGGFHAPNDAAVDPARLLKALAAACRGAGVEIVEGEEVAAGLGDGRLEGVRTASGMRIHAPWTVMAAGCWSGTFDWLDPEHRPAIRPVKGEILTLGPAPSLGGDPVCERIVVTPRVYLVPRRDGRIVVGATVEDRGFDTRVTAGGVHELLREAYRALPDVAEMELLSARAGLRPATSSGRPLVGRSELEGLILATGHFRNGILLAPATAEDVVALLEGAAQGAGPA